MRQVQKPTPISDQWLLEGKCELCRRKNYCSTKCKKARIRTKMLLDTQVRKDFANAWSDIIKAPVNTPKEAQEEQ
jgi:radical SAM protein with 4Fe4S-binding SPASM domain